MKSTQKVHSNTLALVTLALAATVRAQTTAKVFVPNIYAENLVWDASIIGACADSTTYALHCTASPVPPTLQKSLGALYTSQVAAFCDPSGPAQVVTAGPSGFYQTAKLAVVSGSTVMGTVSCDLSGTTKAVCSGTLAADGGKHSTATAAAETLTGAQLPFVDVTITGGSEKLAKATGNVCVSGGTSLSASLALTAVVLVSGICAVCAL